MVAQTAQDLHETLESFRQQGAHLLLPSTYISELPRFHKIVVDRVFLSADTSEGDVYLQDRGGPNGKSKYAPTRQGLMKLAHAAGVMWDPARCVRLDDRKDRDYVVYQAVGGMKKIDGSPLFFKAEYDLDFEVIEEEIREGYENKARMYGKDPNKYKWWHKMDAAAQEAYLEKCIRRDVLQKRKHKAKLAETGAMTRVVRALLGLKSAYTAEELEAPFIVVRSVFQPDYDNPDVKQEIARASIAAVTGVFGQRPHQPPLQLVSSTEQAETVQFPDDVPEAPEEGPPEGEGEGEPIDGPPDGAEEEEPDAQIADFLAQASEDRINTISEAAKQRGIADSKALWKFYKEQTGKEPPKSVKAMPEKDMVTLYKALLALPIAESSEPPDDDIPF